MCAQCWKIAFLIAFLMQKNEMNENILKAYAYVYVYEYNKLNYTGT